MLLLIAVLFIVVRYSPVESGTRLLTHEEIQEHTKSHNWQSTICRPVTPPCIICRTQSVSTRHVCSHPVATFKFECPLKKTCKTENPCIKRISECTTTTTCTPDPENNCSTCCSCKNNSNNKERKKAHQIFNEKETSQKQQ